MIFDQSKKFTIKLNPGELAFMKELVNNFNDEVEKLYTSKMLKNIKILLKKVKEGKYYKRIKIMS